MSDKRVPVLAPDGTFGFIDESDVPELPEGARVLTKAQADKAEAEQRQQAADAAEQERYDALPTARKVLGGAATAAQALINPLSIGSNPDAPTEAVAFNQGVTNQLTGGLTQGAVRQGIQAVGSKEAAEKYAQQVEQQRAASPTAYGAGQFMGASAGVLAPVGAAVEAGAAARLGGLAAKGIAGRAAATALEMGARGAVEGGAMKAGEYVGDELLADRDLAADKLFAATGTGALYGGITGTVLGGAGSLAKSGIVGALARRGESAATATTDAAAKAIAGEAPPPSGSRRFANEMAIDALGSTKGEMSNALEYVAPKLADARQAVGDYVRRQVIAPLGESGGLAGAWNVGKSGRADQLLPLIQADKAGRIASGLNDALNASPARVSMRDIAKMHADIYTDMTKRVGDIAGADAFDSRLRTEMQALYNAGKVAEDGTVSAVDAFRARSDMARQAYELGRASGSAGEAYKQFLRKFDRHTIDVIDKAAEAAGKNGVGDNIRYWKREWQLASAAEEMALGGEKRVTGNNALGIREGIGGATAIMTGHPILGVVGPIAMKVAKERGKAVAAYTLSQIADRAALAKLAGTQDALIGSASKGLIAAPAKGALKAAEVMPPVRSLAKTGIARVAAFQADPQAYVEHVNREVEPIAAHSPEIADSLVTRQVRAMTFLSSKLPVQGDKDPLDPHEAPSMTPVEEAEFGRYVYYTDKPQRFFQEVARGKITPEGAETARELMPRAFEELQAQTAQALVAQLSRGVRLPFRQRQLLGQLLDFAATPSQRPDHRAFLQQNVADVLPSDQSPSAVAPAKSRRVSITPSGSALDRLEAGGPGHR